MIYKRCILNIIQHKIGNIDNSIDLEEPKTKLFRYFLSNINIDKTDNEIDHMSEWITFSIPQITLLILLNIYCLIKIAFFDINYNYEKGQIKETL